MGDPSDLLDWTITEAPPPDETPALAPHPEPAAHPHFEPPHLSRRIWLLLGGLSALAVLAAALILWRSQWQTEQAVRRVIAQEEQAARAQDPVELTKMLDTQVPGWVTLQTGWTYAGQSAPLPDPALRAVPDAPSVIGSITQVASNTVRAEVARVFAAPDGAQYTFVFAQYYRYADKQWRRTDISASVWGETHEYVGERLTVSYPAIDEAFAAPLGPELDAALLKACEVWVCPDTLALRLNFEPQTPTAADYLINPLPPNEPLMVAQLRTLTRVSTGDVLNVSAPHANGVPADAASTDWLKRALTAQVILRLAREVSGPNQNDNAYLFALTARYLAQHGWDNAYALALETAPTLYFPNELWDMAYAGLWADPSARPEAVLAALAQLNSLLAASPTPAATEAALFLALRDNFRPNTWAAEGLSLTPNGAEARLDAIALSTLQFSLPAALPDFVLSCLDGPFMFDFTEDAGPQEFQPFWRPSEQGRAAYLASWSPTGQWLAMVLFNNLMGINLATGETRLLPALSKMEGAQLWPMAWVSDSVLAYTVNEWSATGPHRASLLFMDLNHPQTVIEPITNAVSYLPSPDQTQAVIVEEVEGGLQLSLMPPLGGPRTLIDRATNAYAWSPDGRAVVYLKEQAQRLQLWRYDVAQHTAQRLWQTQTQNPSFVFSAVAFAPSGEEMAFMYVVNEQAWMSAVRLDGSSQTWPLKGNYVSFPAYSADGAYLAGTVYDTNGGSRTVVYDTRDYSAVREWPGVWGYAWSPTGQRLVTFGQENVSLFSHPRAEPQQLMNTNCFNGLWNPK